MLAGERTSCRSTVAPKTIGMIYEVCSPGLRFTYVRHVHVCTCVLLVFHQELSMAFCFIVLAEATSQQQW